MGTARPIGEIMAEIMADLREMQERYERDCADAVLSCKAAARYIGRSPGTVSRYIAEGRLKKVRSGGEVGIRRSELDLLLK